MFSGQLCVRVCTHMHMCVYCVYEREMGQKRERVTRHFFRELISFNPYFLPSLCSLQRLLGKKCGGLETLPPTLSPLPLSIL